MTSVATTLKRFNRKERYWVVRNALGRASETLDPNFCAQLETVLLDRDVRIDPAEAWWAMDYHFNWLFAALRMHCDEFATGGVAHCNAAGAIRGNQEDIDLVVAAGRELILVEAKNGTWSSDQLRSKLERLASLGANEEGVVGTGDGSVRLHLVLMSPSQTSGRELSNLLVGTAAWMRQGETNEWRWTKLQLDDPRPDCRVHRSNPAGKKDKHGVHWAVAIT